MNREKIAGGKTKVSLSCATWALSCSVACRPRGDSCGHRVGHLCQDSIGTVSCLDERTLPSFDVTPASSRDLSVADLLMRWTRRLPLRRMSTREPTSDPRRVALRVRRASVRIRMGMTVAVRTLPASKELRYGRRATWRAHAPHAGAMDCALVVRLPLFIREELHWWGTPIFASDDPDSPPCDLGAPFGTFCALSLRRSDQFLPAVCTPRRC